MIYYCVKTDEFLQSVLDIVSRGGSHYLQLKVAQAKAESTIQKFKNRYDLDITARVRSYRLHEQQDPQPVLDLVVLQNPALCANEQVLLCLIATLPQHIKNGDGKDLDANDWIAQTYAEKEHFFSVSDRKNRLCYSVTHPAPAKGDTAQKRIASDLSVYELVQLPYTKQERKQADIVKLEGWTWRLDKDYQKYKLLQLETAFKDAQKLKGRGGDAAKQDSFIQSELDILQRMAGFRGVRDDVFKLQRPVLGLYRRYLNRPCPLELKIPRYVMKRSRLCKTFDEMIGFRT